MYTDADTIWIYIYVPILMMGIDTTFCVETTNHSTILDPLPPRR